MKGGQIDPLSLLEKTTVQKPNLIQACNFSGLYQNSGFCGEKKTTKQNKKKTFKVFIVEIRVEML